MNEPYWVGTLLRPRKSLAFSTKFIRCTLFFSRFSIVTREHDETMHTLRNFSTKNDF
jgi:hypothetical protein